MSSLTAAGSRSVGGPYPPPPPVFSRSTAPAGRSTALSFEYVVTSPSGHCTETLDGRADPPPCRPKGALLVRSHGAVAVRSASTRYDVLMPSPPRQRPGPPESHASSCL